MFTIYAQKRKNRQLCNVRPYSTLELGLGDKTVLVLINGTPLSVTIEKTFGIMPNKNNLQACAIPGS